MPRRWPTRKTRSSLTRCVARIRLFSFFFCAGCFRSCGGGSRCAANRPVPRLRVLGCPSPSPGFPSPSPLATRGVPFQTHGPDPNTMTSRPIPTPNSSPLTACARAQLWKDIDRTFPGEDYFQSTRVRDILFHVLYIYSRVYADLSYRQARWDLLFFFFPLRGVAFGSGSVWVMLRWGCWHRSVSHRSVLRNPTSLPPTP